MISLRLIMNSSVLFRLKKSLPLVFMSLIMMFLEFTLRVL